MVSYTVCSPAGLLVQLPSYPPGLSWSAMTVTTEGLGSFSFDGGSVTYDGVSLGSTATYTTSLDYHVNGSRVFQSSCYNDMWTPPAVISYEGELSEIRLYDKEYVCTL